MSTTANVVKFESITEQVEKTAAILGDKPEDIIADYASSLLSKHVIGNDRVTLTVPKTHPLWSGRLESLLKQTIACHRTSDGTPCQLIIQREG